MYTPSYQLLDSYITDSSIVLPRFQRKKTWTNTQKFNLALSIYRGYPIGVVILYKEKQNSAKKYLLDGRQRRNAATEIYLNPSELMKWAFKELKLTKKNGKEDKKEDVLRKFALRIEDYLEQEPTLDEKGEDTDDQIILNDFDESEDDSSEDVEDYLDEVDDKNVFDSEGFSKLRDMIVIAWTNRSTNNDGLCAPFELSKYCTVNPPYYFPDNNKKIDCAELRKFLKRYKEDYPNDEYKDVNNFLKHINMYVNPNKKKALVDEKLSGMWDDMLKVIELFGDLEARIKNTQLSTIDVYDVNMTDAQKIFNLINKGGTQLTAVEVLSARPGWNKVLDNPSSDLQKERKKLYEKLEINVGKDVVKWDVAASFIRRIKHINLVFPVSSDDNIATITKQATQGFQLLSGVYKKSITKAEYETLYKNSDIDWTDGIDELVDDFGKMLEIVSETTYFYYFQTWNTCLSKVLSEGCAIDFLLVDSKTNSVKNNKELKECKSAEPSLIDAIVAYEGIKVADFDKYSNPSNWPSLQTERFSLFKATFVNEDEKKSDRTIYLEETY